MSWTPLDADFPWHPKVVLLGKDRAAAGWLHIEAICYAQRFLTDGFISAEAVSTLTGGKSPRLIDALVSIAGLWERRTGGYLIHDFLDYNRSRIEVEQQRTARAEKCRVAGKARAGLAKRDAGGRFTRSEPAPPATQPAPPAIPTGGRVSDPDNGGQTEDYSGPASIQRPSIQSRRSEPASPAESSADTDTEKERHTSTVAVDADFETFWEAYPPRGKRNRREGKTATRKCWQTLLRKGIEPETLISAAKAYAVDTDDAPPDKRLLASTFLGPTARYEDYIGLPDPSEVMAEEARAIIGGCRQ